jgi:hypothetical protein
MYEIYKRNSQCSIEHIVKFYNTNDKLFSGIQSNKYVMDSFDENWDKWVSALLGLEASNTEVPRVLKKYYFPKGNVDLSKLQDRIALIHLISDGLFNYPVFKMAKRYSKIGGKAYLYMNSYQNRFSVFDILSKVPTLTGNELLGLRPQLIYTVGLLSDLVKYWLTNDRPSNYGTSHGDSVLLLFNVKNSPGIGRHSMDYDMSRAFINTVVDFASSNV